MEVKKINFHVQTRTFVPRRAKQGNKTRWTSNNKQHYHQQHHFLIELLVAEL
jgi:hypothetical protein